MNELITILKLIPILFGLIIITITLTYLLELFTHKFSWIWIIVYFVIYIASLTMAFMIKFPIKEIIV
jgi:hypothetical protein